LLLLKKPTFWKPFRKPINFDIPFESMKGAHNVPGKLPHRFDKLKNERSCGGNGKWQRLKVLIFLSHRRNSKIVVNLYKEEIWRVVGRSLFPRLSSHKLCLLISCVNKFHWASFLETVCYHPSVRFSPTASSRYSRYSTGQRLPPCRVMYLYTTHTHFPKYFHPKLGFRP